MMIERGPLLQHSGFCLPGMAILLLALLLVPSRAVCGPVTVNELGGVFRIEYSRVFTNCFEFEANAGLEILRIFRLEGGISVGSIGTNLDFNSFALLGIQPLFFIPLRLNLNYIHNNIPDFKITTHSVIPYLSWEGRRAGISLGANFRYTVFDYEAPIDESIFVFSLYLNLVNNQRLTLGLRYANFNNFLSGNMGSYSLSLYSIFRLRGIVYLRNDIELLQTGSVGLVANFYGISYKGGVVLRW